MTTPQYPDPHQLPDPGAYQPPSGAYPPPDPGAYQPPSGAYRQPAVDPQTGGGYPPDPNAYRPPDPNAYPPPGQPGGGYPPPPGTPGGPVMPGEQPKKSNTPRIVMAVAVVAVVVLGVILYFVNRSSDPDYAEAGDCIQYASDTDVSVVDCTSPGAEYKVVKRVDDTSDQSACADSADTDVTLFTKSENDSQYTLCVSLVVAEGDCVSTNGDKLACSDPDAAIKIVKVLDGTTDDSGCPEGTADSIVHQADDQVLCLAQNS